MRYQQTAIHFYDTHGNAWPITAGEIRGLLFSTIGFVVFVAMFAFVAFGDSLAGR
jgi:hypothetical protein